MKYLVGVVVLVLALALFYAIGRSIPRHQSPQQQTTSNEAKVAAATNASPQNSVTVSKGALPDFPFAIAAGFSIHVFAKNLGDPRVLAFSPGGTLLVSDPNDNEVIALPDKNGDGVADSEKVVISGENHVHGLAFYNGKLYIADVDKVAEYSWDENSLTAAKVKDLFNLPDNSDHNNRTLAFDPSGKLYISLGSTCNVCNEAPTQGGSVLVSDANGGAPQVFATGLRNAAFIHFNPKTEELWGTEMGRDNLGDNIPPDEINIIRQGQDYGWPNCYGDKIPDTNFNPSANSGTYCQQTIAPIFQVPAHNAPLGFVFINSSEFPGSWQGDLLVSYHGSWNRSVPAGYKVVHLKVSGNSILSSEDFLTGFLPANVSDGPDSAYARPVDMAFGPKGNLYLSDDKAGNIFIIQKQ